MGAGYLLSYNVGRTSCPAERVWGTGSGRGRGILVRNTGNTKGYTGF